MADKDRKVIAVTGAGQGIGRAICLHFAARDFDVAVVEKNKETGQETAELAKLQGSNARAFSCDVTDRDSVRKAFREVDEAFGRLDVLVNNAESSFGQPWNIRPMKRLISCLESI